MKWDRLDALSVLEDPSDKERVEREQLQAEVTTEKTRLEKALPEKRRTKQERQEHAQWKDYVQHMKGDAFFRAFDKRKTKANVRLVIREKEEREEASKKRKAGQMPDKAERLGKRTNARAVQSRKPKSTGEAKVAPAAVQAPRIDQDAEGETDDEAEVMATILAELEEDEPEANDAATPTSVLLETFDLPSRTPSPMLFSQPESADLVIITEEHTAEHTEQASRQVIAPISLTALASWEENTIIEHQDDGYSSTSPSIENPSEQVMSPTEPILPPTPREGDTMMDDEMFAEQVTAPTLLAETPQEEDTVVEEQISEEDDLASLFGDGGDVMEEGNTPVTDSAEAVEDLPAGIFTEEAAPSIEEPEVSEDLPAPMSEEEIASLAAKQAELANARLELTNDLAEKEAELAALDKRLTTSNIVWKKKLESQRSIMEARFEGLKREIEEQKRELRVLEQESAC